MGRKKRGGGGGGEGGKPPPQGNEGGSQPPKQAQAQGGGQQHQQPQQAQAQRGGQQHQQPQQAQAQRGGQHGQHQQTQRAPPPGFETTGQQPQTPAPQGVWGRGGQQPPSQQAPKGRGLPPAGRGGGRVPMPSPGAPAAVPSRDPPGPPSGITMGGQPPEMGLGRDLKQEPARSATEGQQRRPGQQGQKPKVAQPSPAASTSQPQGGPKQAPKGGPPKRDQGGAQRGSGDAPGKKASSPEFGLEASLKNLTFGPTSSQAMTTALRKPPGKLFSQRLGIRVNFLEIFLNFKNPVKYHYDVEIEPAKPKCYFGMIISKFMGENFRNDRYAFDGNKNVYTSRPLKLTGSFTKNVTITDPDRAPNNNQREYSVTIKLAAEIDLSVLQEQFLQGDRVDNRMLLATQCLEIIFKGNSGSGNVIPSGRGFFDPTKAYDIKQGKEVRPGFSHSVILGSKIFLNIDVIYKIFPKSGSVIHDLLSDVCIPPPRGFQRDQGNQPPPRIDLKRKLTDYEIRDLEEFLKGLKVEFKIPGKPDTVRKYRVNGLRESALDKKFKLDNGVQTTVAKYFEQEKGYRLQYPHLPCVWVGNKDRDVCLPIELCTIVPNQNKKFRSNDNDVREIAKYATCRTDQRANNIMREVNKLGFQRNPYLQDFGVTVANDFKQVDGRILIQPNLEYANTTVSVQKGEWRPEIFKGSQPLSNWAILVMDRFVRGDDIQRFRNDIVRWAKQLGMEISNNCREIYEDSRLPEQKLEGIFANCLKDKIQLIFVVIMDDKQMYSKVKKIGETKVGVLTQCIKSRTLKRANESILKNILLKVNIKLNGLNHTLKPVQELDKLNQWCIKRPTMILGADVTHPAPQDKKMIPSVAAVVANHDRHASSYNMEWDFQNPEIRDHEIIQDLKEMVMKQLKFYKEKNKVNPERLLFFRDGVSDGQIDEVRYREVRAVKDACMAVCGSYIPLTFMIVQKRHHTRFFPTNINDRVIYDKRNYNVPAGTVVDNEIVRKDMFEFYLVSHTSILGTARPTKYKIIWDECDITADEIEHLTYHLCHMFNRCTRAVSYPAPTYYAHLACFRIRNYLLTERNFKMSRLKDEKKRLQAKLSLTDGNPSFFI